MFDKSTFASHISNANNRNKLDTEGKAPFSMSEQFGMGRRRGPEPPQPHDEFQNIMNSINSYMNHPPYRKGFTEHMKTNPDAHPSQAHKAGISALQNHLYATQDDTWVGPPFDKTGN
tara:strand:- start:970 stop:1320 length:351 start_codon:yes stop_codon:yes gene_type:complete